jgi:circadian clock protein KaiB
VNQEDPVDDEVESTEEFERAIAGAGVEPGRQYVLKLYVAGMTPNSRSAIANLKRICEEHLEGRYELEVIDIYQDPVLASGEQIIAAPTLIKQLPPPMRRFIGDMSETEKVLVGLDVKRR